MRNCEDRLVLKYPKYENFSVKVFYSHIDPEPLERYPEIMAGSPMVRANVGKCGPHKACFSCSNPAIDGTLG